MNPTLDTVDGRSVLRFERRLAHPVEKVWRAVTEPGHLAHWFPSRVERADLRPGGTIVFAPPAEGMPAHDGRVTEADPPRVLAFVWYEDLLRFELRPDGPGCVLVFTHTIGDRPMAGSYATGWETCLGALESLLAGRPSPPPPRPEDYAARHDAFAAAFGITDGDVRQDAGGWTVRFERMVPHPVEEVWPALVGADTPRAGSRPPSGAVGDHLSAGPVTEAAEPALLEYAWPAGGTPAGRVRWALTGGHPAGTRVVLTQTGSGPAGDHTAALAGWHALLDALAERLRGGDGPAPAVRAKELAGRYAERAEAR